GRPGGERAVDACEGAEGGGPRPLAPVQGQVREGPRDILRRPRGVAGGGAQESPLPNGEAAEDGAGATHRALRRHREAPGLPRAVREDAAIASSARRGLRDPHGEGSPHRHRAGSPDRRHVREVAASRSVHVPRRRRAPPLGGPFPFSLLSLALPPPARAAREWSDYYLAARDRLIPAGRCAEAIKELDEAIRIKPSSGLNEQTYGLQFIDYLPYYQRGRCRVQEEDYAHALLDFKTEEERGPVKKSSEYKELLRLRADAQSQEQARVTRGIRDDAQRLLR